MERIRHRADFLAAAGAARAHAPAFTLQSRKRDDLGVCRVGFTVTRKVGTAVERNRIRRRLRALIDASAAIDPQDARDLVLVGRRNALDRGFGEMLDDLRSAMKRLDRPADRTSHSGQSTAAAAADNDASRR
jgi:ribonuclease P protein component